MHAIKPHKAKSGTVMNVCVIELFRFISTVC